MLERALLLINTVGTGAASFVLALWPGAIPAVIGVHLRPEEFIICYFLAGSEAAICFMCVQTLRSELRDLRVTTFLVLIVLHASTAALSIVGILHGTSSTVMWNVGFRAVIVLLLVWAIAARRAADSAIVESR